MCACIPNGGGEGIIMQSGAVYATILATPILAPFDSHAREEGSMAHRRPSFGPSDKSHMCVYDIPMTGSVSLTSPDRYSQADSWM